VGRQSARIDALTLYRAGGRVLDHRRPTLLAEGLNPHSSSKLSSGFSRRAFSRQLSWRKPRKHWRSDWPSKVSGLESGVPSRRRPMVASMSLTTDTSRLDLAGDARSVHGHPPGIKSAKQARDFGPADKSGAPSRPRDFIFRRPDEARVLRRGAAKTKRASVLGLAAISPPHPSRSHPGSAVPPPQLRHHPRPANPGQSHPPSETPDQDLQSRGTIGRQAHEPSDARREAA